MIPPVREFLSACEFLARRFAWDLSPHDEALIEALVEARLTAEILATASSDEVAALFYAFAVPSPALGEDYITLIVVVTLNHAMAQGRRPTGDARSTVRALSRWAHEIAAGTATFESLRAWLSTHFPPR